MSGSQPSAKIISEFVASEWKLSKMLNPSAIYSITPVTEETARAAAKSCSAAPVTRWDVQDLIDRETKNKLPGSSRREQDLDDYEDSPV